MGISKKIADKLLTYVKVLSRNYVFAENYEFNLLKAPLHKLMAFVVGLEPTTHGLTVHRSNQLNYTNAQMQLLSLL